MRLLLAIAAFWALSGPILADRQRPAGDFDHYILALSWSPAWCAQEGRARGAEQCAPGRRLGFVLHGLWPQYERGWPAWCRSGRRDPSRAESAAMADIMGSAGLAWHQWKKHGRCTGLSAGDYYALMRQAWARVVRPEALRRLERAVRIDARVIEQAFLEANPELTPDAITIVCRDGAIREVRICLNKDLSPRPCAPESARDCRGMARLDPPR
ncbi:ribonuclease T2 family protein [Oceanicella actignis]|uniref:Ribonuclease T2 n=1 Tax=Oceanicella actignis TaxID=1189325 RepID=A0A1M7TF44_9RHOB|nr:ribonuclease T2 [Oceanicella actignis]TYO88555.1 ribonuclease T2 [Oceanicella actignis]SET61331.1 ribonuclease T2 [Oceanicella actignis]SHN69379.1 ribonuclease T2 [Oceanicella actignis]